MDKITAPCPFCRARPDEKSPNTDASILWAFDERTPFLPLPRWYVICERCNAQGPTATTESEAIRLWNQWGNWPFKEEE